MRRFSASKMPKMQGKTKGPGARGMMCATEGLNPRGRNAHLYGTASTTTRAASAADRKELAPHKTVHRRNHNNGQLLPANTIPGML